MSRTQISSRKESEDTSWQCTTKGCLARLKTDHEQENIVWSRRDHNHDPVSADSVTRQILRTECKRKAAENLTERPSKVIMKEIVSKPDTDLVPKDLIAIRFVIECTINWRRGEYFREMYASLPICLSRVSSSPELIKS
ncbi:hypothetical protein ElyMa_003895300 [Elysia marginata]|uniref:FLYWCH-type domain-containing protein n=1 Tax=Elysia marginata TaxID=1093978 RepID=A0AAV4FMR0_9GAST|nr:hypothetical protein ElyMa_003895300 [Elysia marginata]